MGRRRELHSLPEVPDGLTMTDLARRLSARLGVEITPRAVYAAAVATDRVPLGRAERLVVPPPRRAQVLVIAPRYAGDVEGAVRAALRAKAEVGQASGLP
jgi:hypothetical protein